MQQIASLDWVVISGYFALIIVIGVVVSRRTSSGEDLFLAGRSLTLLPVGLSLFASNISSTTLVGLMGQAYTSGLSVANYEWMAAIIFIFMAAVTVPVFLKNRLNTVPEFLLKRFGVVAQRYFSGLTILVSLAVDTAGGLYAGTLILQSLFPELPFLGTAVTMALFVGLYTAIGGLKAVVYTDMLQALVLVVGAALMLFVVMGRFDFSLTAVTASLPEGHFSLMQPWDDTTLPWIGTVFGLPIIGLYFWSMNQYIAQRVLAARDIEHARLGCTVAGYLKLTPLFLMVLPGALAPVLFPALEEPDQVFAKLTLEVLPAGIRGLVLAGLIAAIMSSLDSTLNSASTLILHDFLLPMRDGHMSDRARLWFGRISTFGLAVLAALWAPLIANFHGLFAYLQQVMAYLAPPVVVVFIWGIFTQTGSRRAAMFTMIPMHVVGIACLIANHLGLLPLHFTVHAAVLAVIACVLYVTLAKSMAEAPTAAKGAEPLKHWQFSWTRPIRQAGLWRDYRAHSAALLVLVALMLVFFW